MSYAAWVFVWLGLGSSSAMEMQTQPDWAEVFSRFDAQGTMVVLDARNQADTTLVHNPQRAQQRLTPASTFKIPHTLFALDAGLVDDEFQVFVWDGTEHSFAGHNADQDLRSAMRVSAVWVYEGFANALGLARSQQYLRQLDYGNADASSNADTELGAYWVDGNLAISAHEQVAFLQRLYRNALPYAVEHQRLVKDVMVVEADREWILRAKTGWSGSIGWWVGWVEWPTGPVFFALNIDTPNRMDDLAKREQIARAILASLDALPAR